MQHYDEKYFTWQDRIGQFGGKANLFKFAPYIAPTDRVLDFGCGGGHLLHNIQCAEKIGLEVNPSAREQAKQYGFPVHEQLSDVPQNWANVIVSNHVLEHVECPVCELRDLLPKLQRGGKLIIVVPHQTAYEPYTPQNANQHLQTWNPLTLGTLLETAGYENITVDTLRYAWKPQFARWYRLGQWAFDLRCRMCAYLENNYQIRAIGHRPTG